MNEARVFVVQSPMYRDKTTGEVVTKYDLTPAKRFGRLVPILGHGKLYRDQADDAMARFEAALSDFTADDYILAIGDPAAICGACMVAAQRSRIVKMLRWDRLTYSYEVVRLALGVRNAEAEAENTRPKDSGSPEAWID